MRRQVTALIGLATLAAVAVALLWLAPWSSGSSVTGDRVQGDANCDHVVDSIDALADLRYTAMLDPQTECLLAAGDVNCSDVIDSIDALEILRYVAHLPAISAAGGSSPCPAIGQPVRDAGSPSPSPAASPSPSPAASPTASSAPTPSPTATPTPPPGTPRPGGYGLAKLLESSELEQAVEFAMIPGSSDAALVATQDGKIWRVSLNGGPPAAFGDINGRLTSGGEEGLLSLAFSPNFQSDGRVYLYYTKGSPQPSILSRFQATATHLDESSEKVLLQVPQPFANHNGGHIAFGHDDLLYLSLGDGGSGGDPNGNGQNTDTLLAKVLRVDVSGASYTVPPDNPFAGGGGRGEVFAYGLRNPWRMTVDSLTGDIWLGDVGQGKWEEVDRLVKGGNFGWNCYEGPEPYHLSGCPAGGFQPPRAYYGHDQGNAITGGFVYRGSPLPELYGWYVYADFYSGRVWAVDTSSDSSPPVLLAETDSTPASFAELPDRELAIVDYKGAIYQITRG